MDNLFRLFLTLISRALMLTVFMPASCCAKALVSKLLGDDTPERDGRLSMDFRKHTDRNGIFMMLLLGFGWGKEMNSDVSKVKRMKLDITIISLAAPVAYFLMYIILYNISGLIYSPVPQSFIAACIYKILRKAGYTCLCFGVIDLLPIPPLGGFQIFYQFSWPKFRRWYFTNYHKINYWSVYVLYAIFLMHIITDGEFSILGLFVALWSMLLDHLVFFDADWANVPEKIYGIIFKRW